MLIVIAVIIIFIFWLLKDELRKLQLAWNMNGPKALPILGNALIFLNKSSVEFLETVRDLIRENGKFFRLWLGNELLLVLTGPEDVQFVLTSMKMITKSSEYKYMEPWLNFGLLTSTGEKWLKRRKILTPAFHFKILDEFIEVFEEQSSILVEKLRRFDGKGYIDIFPIVALSALDIICETAMGISLKSQSNSESQYVKNVNELADIIHQRTFNIIARYDVLYKFTKTYRRQTELIKQLHEFTESVIKARREELLKKHEESESSVNYYEGSKKKKALLDLLLETSMNGQYLSDNNIREEIDTFMFEGHDTTASAIAYTLYNIAKHKDVQTSCFDEIEGVLGNNEKITMKTLNDLRYLEVVCKESLRLYPSVPIFGRRTTEEIQINKHLVPKGTNIILAPYFMARDPSIFGNPMEFKPERFAIEKDNETSNPFAYIPFSGGFRNCIGQKFAMLEMKSTIAKILLNYHISVPDTFAPQDSLELIIKSKNGILLEFKSR